MKRSRLRLALACAVLTTAWIGVPDSRAQGIPDQASESHFVPGLGSSTLGQRAWEAIEQEKYVRAREIADRILRADPSSPEGHATLGVVLRLADGSLPRALYHLELSRKVFEERHGRIAFDPAPWRWHRLAMREAAQVTGAMGQEERKLQLLAELEELHGEWVMRMRGERDQWNWTAERGWPLMRLRRYDDARRAVTRALELDPVEFFDQHVTAQNALCAIEGEQQNREETYRECLRSAELDRGGRRRNDPVAYTNAAIGALAVLRMDEAEELILEGGSHFDETVANPWLDLMVLYVAQGRMAEALDAMRGMLDWRRKQPPYMDEQNRAQTEVAAATFLILAGRPFDAARITGRSIAQPDRTGYTSSGTEQMESASGLIHALALEICAQHKLEEASWSPLWDGSLYPFTLSSPSLEARAEALELRLEAWSASRRAASLLAEDRILVSTVRPYLPGGSETAEWVQLELPRRLGSGVVASALAKAREIETIEGVDGYFLAFDAEIARQHGDTTRTLELAQKALKALPGPEVLLQGHMAAIGAEAAWENGDRVQAEALFSQALQIDPGLLRRLDIALPVRITATADPVAQQAAALLEGSPRLTEGGQFRVHVEGGKTRQVCLHSPQDDVLGCATLELRAGDTDDRLARRLVAAFHAEVFAPRLDLTQQDIRSLDGSTTAGGGRSRERLHTILDGLVGHDPEVDRQP